MTSDSTAEKPLVLITGISGLLGTRLVRELAPDYRIVGLDVVEPQVEGIEVPWIETDLTDDESVSKALGLVERDHGKRLASVIHLAAYYDFSGEPSPMYEKLTVEGTRRLLRELNQRDLTAEQFVFSSSLLVMQPSEERPLTEDSPTRAEWDYPQSKLEAERVIDEERGSIPAVILRIAGVYDDDGHSLPLSQQIARIYERQLESYVFPGDADHGQALVHLDDLADCFRRAIERRSELDAEEVFLVAEPAVVSYRDLQEQIGELVHGQEWPALRIPKTVAKAGAYVKDVLSAEQEQFIKPWMIKLADDHYAVDIGKARHELGWEPQRRLQDTVPSIVGALKRDPQNWYEEHGLPMPDEVAKS